MEMFSREIAPGLKFGEGPSELTEYFQMVGDFLDMKDRGIEIDAEFLAQLRELHRQIGTLVDGPTDEP
ncbi:MAG TPA: hypothetical protein VKH20_06325 [Solirubrobacterales bacterium]|nr:hypothetical protein [Solirubrobacterales bacterium]